MTTLSEADFLAYYQGVLKTITEPTADHFLALVDTSSSSATKFKMFHDNWDNQEAKQAWTYFFPDLSQLPRLNYLTDGEWAAYYFEAAPEDAGWVDISIIRMHFVDGAWKLSLEMGATTIASIDDPVARAKAIAHEIETEELLSIVPQSE